MLGRSAATPAVGIATQSATSKYFMRLRPLFQTDHVARVAGVYSPEGRQQTCLAPLSCRAGVRVAGPDSGLTGGLVGGLIDAWPTIPPQQQTCSQTPGLSALHRGASLRGRRERSENPCTRWLHWLPRRCEWNSAQRPVHTSRRHLAGTASPRTCAGRSVR